MHREDPTTPAALPPRVYARELAAIFAGGLLGTLARGGLAQAAPASPGAWPWPTFAVNVAGALLLGWAAARLRPRPLLSPYWRPFVGVGICGALTTFSTLQLELVRMLDDGRWGLALGYAGASVSVGLGAVLLGARLARRGRTER